MYFMELPFGSSSASERPPKKLQLANVSRSAGSVSTSDAKFTRHRMQTTRNAFEDPLKVLQGGLEGGKMVQRI